MPDTYSTLPKHTSEFERAYFPTYNDTSISNTFSPQGEGRNLCYIKRIASCISNDEPLTISLIALNTL